MPFKTRLTEMLGIEHPIVMGGMTGPGTPELAAAVSRAGGLGILCAHNAGSPEKSREWIARCRELCEGKPFGVNLTLLPTLGPAPPYEEYAKAIIESGVKIVETAGSDPRKFVPLFKSAGLITIHKCTSIRHSQSAIRAGVDIVSLDGFECAGHPGEDDVGNFVLQAKGAKVLTKPYICSGGVGDGIQLAASLALGADGVNCGTRFCATKESNWPESYKKRMETAEETDSILLFRPLINTTRVFKNRVSVEAKNIEMDKGKDFKIQDVAHLVAGKRGRAAEKKGDPEDGIWSGGQVNGLIDDTPTVQELMDRMVKEAEECVRSRLNGMLTPSKL